MAKTYTKAPDDVRDMCVGLMQRNHPKLAEFQLRVDVVFVATDSETANALSCGGYPAQAVVRILDSKQRAMGRGDAEITIDEENWLALTAREQMALLDHELYHITLRGGGLRETSTGARSFGSVSTTTNSAGSPRSPSDGGRTLPRSSRRSSSSGRGVRPISLSWAANPPTSRRPHKL